MTPEYQAILLNQLVGTVQEQQGLNEPQFSDSTTTTTSLTSYISDAGHTGDLMLRFYVSRNNYFLLFYNEYDSNANWVSSFVVVTDEAIEPVALIDSYYSGTPFTAFTQGSRNDIGEGRIFFVSNGRLYYVNDPTAKSPSQPFEMRILNSYELQIGTRTLLSFKKNANGGNFVFASIDYSNYHIFITEFVNNVGFPSEWNTYEYNFNETYFSSSLDFYPLWNDNFSCEVVYNTIDTGDNTTKVVKVLNTNSSGLYLVKTIRTDVDPAFSSSSATLISYNKFAYVADDYSTYRYLHITDLKNNNDYIVKDFENRHLTLKVVNDILFVSDIDYTDYRETIGMVIDGEYYEKRLDTFSAPGVTTFILNKYNLYKFLFLQGNDVMEGSLVFNVNNYNGQAFTDKNSPVANSGVLYDSNGKPVFARNLYNRSFVGNTEIDTLNVPNFLLNNVTVANEKLFSLNNNTIINQTQNITKNQYENLFINFFNTVNIIDNNTNQNIKNDVGSAYFIKGITGNVQSTKYKVTYTDNTTFTNKITDVTVNGLEATLVFLVYVDKAIKKIEIISNDEGTVYATIPSHTYTVGSTYKIEQQIIVEE